MLRGILIFIAGVAVGGFAAQKLPPLSHAQQPSLAEKKLRLLEEENDRLRGVVASAERSRSLEKNKAQREAIEREVEEIRGLKFKTPVDYEVLDRKQIKATLSRKLSEIFSEEEFRHMSAAFARLGLLEPGFPLREKYIDLLGEQVAAFYDQHTHKLFMFEDATLENSQNRVVLAHELTHALQDQHFGLKKLPLEIKTNDDRATASSALCEGDATLVMSEFMLKNLSLGSLKENLSAGLTQNMDQLAKAPRFLRESLIFPYLRGQEFCGALFASGGYDAVNRAYAQPPSSTAQILHPEKFTATPREEPIAFAWSDTTARSQRAQVDNTLGELGIRILFTEWLDASTGEKAAAGWRGDRYLSFDDGRSIVWRSAWANDREAAEFADAGAKTTAKHSAKEPGRVVRWLRPSASEVVLIDAADDAWAQELEAKFAH